MWKQKDNSLYKKFSFENFDSAFSFIVKVASLAKKNNHHPTWTNTYDQVEIWLSTHDENGITEKDERMAEEIDKILDDKDQPTVLSGGPHKLYTDGGSRGNPGPSACAFVLLDSADTVVKKSFKYIGVTTNNQAEYMGLQMGLEIALDLGIKTLNVYMDSLLVVNQVNGVFKVKNPEIYPVNQRVKELVGSFEALTLTHVPREMNRQADQLVNDCLDEQE